MIKTFGILDKRADITQKQFHAHWRGPHAEHAVKLVPVMQRYCQNHKAAKAYPGFKAPCDGCPEVWLEDLEAAAWLGKMPEYLTGAFIDEPNFMRQRSGGVLVWEDVAIEGPEIGKKDKLVKVLFFLKRSPALSHASFVEQWLAQDKPLLVGGDHLQRWVRSPIVEEAYEQTEAAYDGVEELWWATQADQKKDAKGAVPSGLVDVEGTRAMFVDENRVVWPNGG